MNDADSVVVAPSLGPSLAASESTTTVPHLLSKWEVLAITHEVDNLSKSLSFITFTILPSVQGRGTRGTHLENSDSSGITRKMTSSSYLAISVTCTCKIMKLRGPCAAQTNQVERVIHKVPQRQYRELMLAHITRHHHVHLTATVHQGVDLMPLNLETYQSHRANPMHGWPISKRWRGAAHSHNLRSYFLGGLFGAGTFFCRPTPLEFKCSLCQAWKAS